MRSSSEIRQTFFDFFRSKEHEIVPSAPIVVKNDPTLLFTNAGMNQFKEFFLGNKVPEVSRVADTQKCLRVSGKHNDLEEVGVDHYHHTMFEMLGNWSFGNGVGAPAPYFKKEAIAWSWELLTKEYGLPKSDLYVTVFEGDQPEGLPADDESLGFWKQWVPEGHILKGNKKDNFWEMGDTGPCGPCTEIHFDARSSGEKSKVPGSELVNKGHPEVIEIWNNVFIQYNRKVDGSLELLPARHVDTGMGFERLVRLLQNKKSNYDTDIFSGTIKEVERISGLRYEGSQSRKDIAFRVVSDHIRAVVFPVADGQLPSNNGAGYVIRRILRRAVRYYVSYLNIHEPLLYKLVPQIANQFKDVFPEPKQQEQFLEKVILEEETGFLKTLGSGLKRLEGILEEDKKVIGGSVAFELFDTYGFPVDLTQLIAAENNATVDMDGFAAEMQKQKDRSRAAAQVEQGDWVELSQGDTVFVGYDSLESKSRIIRYRQTESKGKKSFQVVLDVTPFYAEMGGQVGDTGWLIAGEEKIVVDDTRRENDLVLHFVKKLPSDLSAELTAKVDAIKRGSTALHHSATHLLHAALRKVLGSHVAQKGSLVNQDYLRFDFSHFAKMTAGEIQKVEELVNEKIRENGLVTTEIMPKASAMKKGAMALFGEKYGDEVRVVSMDGDFSVELCGGTHARRTGDIGFFKIISETAIGAGVRRIEALSGKVADQYVRDQLSVLHQLREKMKNPKDAEKALDTLLVENAELKKELERQEQLKAALVARTLAADAQNINGIYFIGRQIDASNAGSLRQTATELKALLSGFLAVITANIDGKPSVAVVTDEKAQKDKSLDAGKIIKTIIAPLIKGGGGGNAGLATAGGKDASALPEVIERVKSLIA